MDPYYVVGNVQHDDLEEILNRMTLEERKTMERKMREVVGCMMFRDIKDRLLAERMFQLGFLSTATRYMEDHPNETLR